MTEAQVAKKLDSVVAQTERLGVIGSPSSTSELAVDVVGTAVDRKLVGELAMFPFRQDGVAHYALGQITEIELRNIWHEDPTMRSLIRQRGKIDAVSERQDTHLGKMVTSAVFKSSDGTNYEPSILGTVPSTGTAIHLVNDEMLDTILHRYKEHIFYLGHVYGSTPKLPLWFKHFGRGTDGAGEAYHIGIFGKNGSGKSTLAKMALCAYMRHPQMGLLILDPAGEFSKDFRGGSERFPLKQIAEGYKKQVYVLSVNNLVLDRWELFQQILGQTRFFSELQILTQDKVTLACEQLTEALKTEAKKKDSGIKLTTLHERAVFDKVWALLKQDKLRDKIYAREGGAAERLRDAVNNADPNELYNNIWLPASRLFMEDKKARRRTVEVALNWLLDTSTTRPILVVDVSKEQAEANNLFWNDTIQALVIKRLLDGIMSTAERRYQAGEEKELNTLVLIDEAHRLAPRYLPENGDVEARVRNVLIDAVRTTRKYGLGWLFISQTLSSLHTEILQQLRIHFFGFGLSMGQEFQSLRQIIGGNDSALRLYSLFRDPHSSFDIDGRQYSFMTTGPISPLSFAGTPLFLNAFNFKEFQAANNLTRLGSTEIPC